MNFIEQIDPKKYYLKLNVKPNSKKQSILIRDNFLIVKLRSKPIKNKANKELISLLKRKLNLPSYQIRIKSGSKTSNKLIEVVFEDPINAEDLIQKLQN